MKKIIHNFITVNSTYRFTLVLLTKKNYSNWAFSDRKEQFVVDMELSFKAYNCLINLKIKISFVFPTTSVLNSLHHIL